MKDSPEYIAWYRATRCKQIDEDGRQCGSSREIIVDRDLPSVEVSLERDINGVVTKSTMTKPSHRSDYCYYHNKKRAGLFDFVKEAK